MTSALVAYDGSETARDALAFAARRVGPGGRLVVVPLVEDLAAGDR